MMQIAVVLNNGMCGMLNNTEPNPECVKCYAKTKLKQKQKTHKFVNIYTKNNIQETFRTCSGVFILHVDCKNKTSPKTVF